MMKKTKYCIHPFFISKDGQEYCGECDESKDSIDNGIFMRIKSAQAMVNNRN